MPCCLHISPVVRPSGCALFCWKCCSISSLDVIFWCLKFLKSVEGQILSAHPKPALTSIKQHKAQQSLDKYSSLASFLIPFMLRYQLCCHFAGNFLPFSLVKDQCKISWWLINFEYIAFICISHTWSLLPSKCFKTISNKPPVRQEWVIER